MPQPDFPLTSGRQPARFELESVQSSKDLYAWAVSQKNCAFSKIGRILAGQMLLFKVRRPLRGTLSLVPGAGDNWQIDEFKAAENKPVPRTLFCEMAAHLNRCMARECEEYENEPKQHAV